MQKTNQHYSMSICLPVYRGSHVLGQALKSIIKQKFTDYEILIGDDNSPSDEQEIIKTKQVIASFKDKRIKYFKNVKNLGYPLNLKQLVAKATKNIIFLMAQDDLLSQEALQVTHDAFWLDPDIGVVTRPYFWYFDDTQHPVRVVLPYDAKKDCILSVDTGEKAFIKVFESVGQLSGLAYKRQYLTVPFSLEVFPAHIYPFAGIFKTHKCVFLHKYTVAVSIKDSQTRYKSSIYHQSPTNSWLKMYSFVFSGQDFRKQRQWGIQHMSTHFEGLVQLKNHASFRILIDEIAIMLTSRWQNIFNLRFWFYTILTILTPRSWLIYLTDWYKSNILAHQIPKINFKHY